MTTFFGPVTFDQTPIVGATLDDLDLEDAEQHIIYSRDRGRYQGGATELMPFLIEQRCVAEIDQVVLPTVAGILFFGKHPQRFLPYATTKLAHYRGTTINSNEVRHIEEYSGNIRDQVDRAVEYLENHIERGYTLERGAQRQERPQYPPTALRELTVNALAHRDYTIMGSSTRIAIFPNRIEWSNPGSLPGGITLENILDMQYARNPQLTQLLYQRGYVEAYGQGLDTVFNLLSSQGLPPPNMREAGNTFVVAIAGHALTGIGAERLNGLTDPQLQIIGLLRERSRSAPEIYQALASRSERSIQYDLRILIDQGLIERLGKARAITYVLAVTQ
jgi:predicted HTH transcriptional regulator